MQQTEAQSATIPDFQGSHSFAVRYDDEMLNDAVRTFVWRRVVVEQKMMWIVSALMTASSVYFLFWGGAGWIAGVMLVLGLMPLVFVSIVWRSHKASTVGRYRRMADPKADIVVDEQGIDVASDLGSGRIAWRNVTEVWERPRAFMIFSGDGQFNTLPRATMPEPVQTYLRTRPILTPPDGPA